MPAILEQIEQAASDEQADLKDVWQQLVRDVANGVERDVEESRRILRDCGKSLDELRAAVDTLKKIDALQAELPALRAAAADLRPASLAHQAEIDDYEKRRIEHGKLMEKLQHRVSIANSKKTRLAEVVQQLKNLGCHTDEQGVAARQRVVDDVKAIHAQRLRRIQEAETQLRVETTRRETIARNLEEAVGGGADKLAKELEGIDRFLDRSKQEIAEMKSKNEQTAAEVQAAENRLQEFRNRLVTTPAAD